MSNEPSFNPKDPPAVFVTVIDGDTGRGSVFQKKAMSSLAALADAYKGSEDQRAAELYTIMALFNHIRAIIHERAMGNMTPADAIEAILDAFNSGPEAFIPPRPKIKIVVNMWGGTIEDVIHDNPGIDVTDVVFLEGSKYGSGGPEHDVKDGPFADQIIYAHLCDIGQNPFAVEQVMKVAQERIDDAEKQTGQKT